MDYIESHEEEFKPFVEDDLSFKEYCQSMREDGTWAGHVELQAISLLTLCNICIHRYQSPRWHIRNFGDSRARVIHISYHDGEHYNSVRLIDDETWEPAKPIFIQSDEQLANKPVPQKDQTSSTSRNVKVNKIVVEDETAAKKSSNERKERKVAEKMSSLKEEARCAATVSDSIDDLLISSVGETKAKTTENSALSGRLKKSLKGDQTTGRNQPCPCGSKKKYKVCCGVVANPAPILDLRASEKLSNKERKVRVKDEVLLYNRRRPIRVSSCQVDEPSDVDMGALCI